MHLNATLFGQMITFAIFVWFTMRVIWPLLITQLNQRQKFIADGMAAAEQGHKIMAEAAANATAKIAEAKQHCHQLIEDADNEATLIIDNAKAQAQKENDKIVAAGNAKIAQAVKQAKVELQTQIAGIVVLGAEKILERSINAADHRDILDDLAKKLA